MTRPSERVWVLFLVVALSLSVIAPSVGFVGTVAAADEPADLDASDLEGNGTVDEPYNITNASELQAMEDDLSAHYRLANDVNASNTSNWDGGNGFAPIGDDVDEFTGSLEGQGHIISNLTIDRGGESRVGLFGYVDGGSIANVTLKNGTVTGDLYVGSLVGWNDGDVTGSTSSGDVEGNLRVGGLVGNILDGSVSESYATGSVTGGDHVGGFVGSSAGDIDWVYATGTVSGDQFVGGLVGSNSGTVTDSYWDMDATGQPSSFDGTGLTTSEMTGANATETMDGFAFTDTWHATDSYPALAWEDTDPFYGLTVEETTSPDESRETFEVTVNVTNWGADGGSQTITLTDTDFSDTEQDSESTDLDSGDSTELTLTWDDSEDDDGDGVVTVASDDDSETVTVWPYAGGDGSADNPYEIETWYHLDTAREDLDSEFDLTADLDSNTAGYDEVASETANGGDGFEPIGEDGDEFIGTFDGQGHTISDLTIDRDGESRVGLFGASEGVLTNVTLTDVDITGDDYVGGLVGLSNDGAIVRNASAQGSVTGTGTWAAGGLVGTSDADSEIRDSDANVTVVGDQGVGGLVGSNGDTSGSTVTNSSASGTVEGGFYGVGGLVGGNYDTDVTGSHATGDVSGDADSSIFVGGLIGEHSNGNVTDSYATGDVHGRDVIGGLVGGSTNDIERSFATGSVDGNASAGGLVGLQFEGNTSDAYATGDVNGSDHVGGVVGENGGNVSRTFATGSVTAVSDEVGGLVGQNGMDGGIFTVDNGTDGTLADSYWDVNTTGQDDAIGQEGGEDDGEHVGGDSITIGEVAGLETAEMQGRSAIDNLTALDFDADWWMQTEPSDDYPTLRALSDGFDPTIDDTNDPVTEGQTLAIDVTVENPDADADTQDVTLLVDGDVVDTETLQVSGDDSEAITLEWETGIGDAGVFDLEVATDNAIDTVEIEVVADATDPTADAGSNRTVDEDTQVDFNGSNSTDDGVIVSYEWAFGDGNASTGETTNHTFADPGTYVVELTVTDGGGNTDTDTVTITVADVTNPTADAGADQTVDEDVQVDFDATASTDNGDIDSYDWDFADGGATDTGSQPSYTFADPGTYEVELTVTDGRGNTDTDTVTITVGDVTAPITDAGPNQTVDEDTAVTFDVSGTTDNGVIDSYEWSFGDGSPNATGVTTTHTYADPGTYTVNLTATDEGGNEGTDTLVVTVNDTTAPTAVAGPNQTVDEDDEVSFNGSNSTDNVGIDTFEWDLGDGNTSTGVTANHTYPTPGTYTVTLTANDSAGNDDSDSVVVTVNDITAPTADAGANQTVEEDSEVSFDGSNSTDNGVIDSYEWDFGDGTNATGATANHTYSQPGTYIVNLTVTDAAGHTATDVLTVTVQTPSEGSPGSSIDIESDDEAQDSTSDQPFSFVLVDGAGSTDLDGSIVSIEIVFAADDASGTVTVDPSDERPTDADPIPAAPGLAFVDVTVPSELTDAEATMQVTLDADALDDTDPSELVLYHYDDGEWTALETSVVATDGDVVIEATTPGFSIFAVGSTAGEATATSTPATSPPTTTATPPTTSASEASPTPTASTTETTGQPGFGIGVAVLALLAAVAIAVRRRS